jgi:hypothetical protein
MLNEEMMLILRCNIYNCLIDHNLMKKLAEETFKNIAAKDFNKKSIFQDDSNFDTITALTLSEVKELVQKFTMLIGYKNIFTEQEIETIYKECLATDQENLNQDDFIVFFQIFLELLYELISFS